MDYSDGLKEGLNDHQLKAGGIKARRAEPPTERESVYKTVVLNHGQSAFGGLKPPTGGIKIQPSVYAA